MSISFELPFAAGEIPPIAEILFQFADRKAITDETRQRAAMRAAALELKTLTPYWGSLQKDPTHESAWFLAVDGSSSGIQQQLLLRIALASSPASALFPNSVLIGRMRTGSNREIVANTVPFRSSSGEAVRRFAEKVDRVFLPRPQGTQSAIAAGNRHPEISLPAAFAAFRAIQKKTGLNLASTVQLSAMGEMATAEDIESRDGEDPVAAGHTRVSIADLYNTGLWAAIRSGWREGYNAEADGLLITGETDEELERSMVAAKEAIRQAAGYTKFTTDTSRLLDPRADTRHAEPYTDSEVEDRFVRLLSAEDAGWVLDEFSGPLTAGATTYYFTPMEVRRLAVKFCRSLLLNEDLYDHIRRVKLQSASRSFDFEPSLAEAETLTTAKELLFYMHWLKARGRAAQLVAPNLGFKKRQAYPVGLETTALQGVGFKEYAAGTMWPELLPRVMSEFDGNPTEELRARVSDLAAVARYFNATLSIHKGSGKQPEILEAIGRATNGRWNYKISGELQLQLFDVLYEQPLESGWRKLYERMVARCHVFARGSSFGAESALAEKYERLGRGVYLGDSLAGRTDGNLFLVLWLGNISGSRDIDSPDGDQRFFSEKLNELPAELVSEVRRRNTEYIVWLAQNLRG